MTKVATRLLALFMLTLLAACITRGGDERRAMPNPHEKVGSPYQIQGRWYYPKAEPNYEEVGMASWYGPNFHGKLTANGEIFDQHRLTAAHRTMPLPSIAEVTNLENGKTLLVRVNDRGPFANERILDLSQEAAERLGTIDQGIARVHVRYIGQARLSDAITRVGQRERGQSLASKGRTRRSPIEPVPGGGVLAKSPPSVRPMPASPGVRAPEPILVSLPAPLPASRPLPTFGDQAFYVQVGAFSSRGNASTMASQLPAGLPVDLARKTRQGMNLTVVRLGPFTDVNSAQQALETARGSGFYDAIVVREGLN
ncbi:MAG: septal ring lytic transglycosylase RlpA family protein [Pseudomonadota bacterium]